MKTAAHYLLCLWLVGLFAAYNCQDGANVVLGTAGQPSTKDSVQLPTAEPILVSEANSTLPSTTEPTTVVPDSTTPNITTTSSPNITTSTVAPTTTTVAPDNSTTTITPNSTTTTTSTTPAPITTTTPAPNNTTTTPAPITTTTEKPEPVPCHRFDGPSFIGGIVLTLGLLAIGLVAYKFYKARNERNYHTL